MTSEGSVSQWIAGFKAGDEAAAQWLWERYFAQLVGLCHKRLSGHPRRAADEEDVALSAFASFLKGAQQGRFPRLHDRDGLWRLLVVIAARKVVDQREHDSRQKRGEGKICGESVLTNNTSSTGGNAIDQVVGREPTPEFAASVVEEYERLLEGLTDPTLRSITMLKMEGYTNAEIADRLGCVRRTVERKLRVIRKRWAGKEPN